MNHCRSIISHHTYTNHTSLLSRKQAKSFHSSDFPSSILQDKMGRVVNIEKIPGDRKHDLIAVEGYTFERNRALVEGFSYRCVRKGCKAILHVKCGGSILMKEHIHGPNFEK